MGDISTEIPTLSGSGKSFTTSTRAAASVNIIVRTPDLYNDASSLSVHLHLLDANGNPQVTTVAPVVGPDTNLESPTTRCDGHLNPISKAPDRPIMGS